MDLLFYFLYKLPFDAKDSAQTPRFAFSAGAGASPSLEDVVR